MRGVSNSDREEKANDDAKKWITSNNASLVDHFAVRWKVKLTEESKNTVVDGYQCKECVPVVRSDEMKISSDGMNTFGSHHAMH